MTLGICSTTIDWDATGSMLQGIGQMATLPLLIWATHVGRQTITKYRQQHQSEKAVAAAERVLTAAYAAREAISSVRSPLIEIVEQERAERKLREEQDLSGIDPVSVKKLARAQLYLTRLNNAKAEFDAVWAVMPTARAFFGEDVYNALDNIAHQRRVIQVSAESIVDDDGRDKSFSQSIRGDLTRGGKNDELGKLVDDSVAFLEEQLLPILRAEPIKKQPKPKAEKP